MSHFHHSLIDRSKAGEAQPQHLTLAVNIRPGRTRLASVLLQDTQQRNTKNFALRVETTYDFETLGGS